MIRQLEELNAMAQAWKDRYAVPWDADASEARALWRGHGQNCGTVEQESGRMNNDLVSREAVEQIFSKMWFTVRQNQNLTDEEVKQIITKGRMELNRLPPEQPEYEEISAGDAAALISPASIMPAIHWYEKLVLLEQMGFVICQKKSS